ncbi:uncharacterized protein LOC113312651 [Papaver somniferum]|uniref:uncharacterized protein LOC113312651 n=1 Tax=Papaver somniferum TaxID=3469 RepID=UPI000E700463|nr:uncharacterized protein LOC113312651 [Papaver somniferum]
MLLGITTTLAAENWAMHIASKTATERGWSKVQFETDSKSLMRFITSDTDAPWYISNLVVEIKQRLTQIQQYTIRHIYREGNQAADGLANRTTDDCSIRRLTTTIWEHAIPQSISFIVIADSMDITYPV